MAEAKDDVAKIDKAMVNVVVCNCIDFSARLSVNILAGASPKNTTPRPALIQ